MLVFEVVVNATHQGFGAGTYILPADRCAWEYAVTRTTGTDQQTATSGGYIPADGNYKVDQVLFYRATDIVTFGITDTVVDSVRLGTIGKSGRFVAMTV